MLRNLKPQIVYRTAGGVAAFGLILIALSAIFSGQSRATITGRVTFQGKPVIWGSVVVIGADGRTVAGRIDQDGTYRVENAATGTVTMGVISRDPLVQNWATNVKATRARPTAKAFTASPVDRKKWFPLPQHLEDPNQSGLTAILRRGSNENDIDFN